MTITDNRFGTTATLNSLAVVEAVPITVAPRAFVVAANKSFSGALATFSDGELLNDPSFYTAIINWGDGSPTSTGTISGANPFTVAASHVFPSFENTQIVTITITDKNGRAASAVDRVVDPPIVPAAITLLAGGLTIPRNTAYQGVVASFLDSGPALPSGTYYATIQWGRGRKEVGRVVGVNGGFVVSTTKPLIQLVAGRGVMITVADASGRVVSASETASYPVVVRHPRPVPHPKPVKTKHGR